MNVLLIITILGLGSVLATEIPDIYKDSKEDEAKFTEVTEENLCKFDVAGKLLKYMLDHCESDLILEKTICNPLASTAGSFEKGNISAEDLKAFLTKDVVPLLKKNLSNHKETVRWWFN